MENYSILKPRILYLDALRLFATIAVICIHYTIGGFLEGGGFIWFIINYHI